MEKRFETEAQRLKALEDAIGDVEKQVWVQSLTSSLIGAMDIGAEIKGRFAKWEPLWRKSMEESIQRLGIRVIEQKGADLRPVLDDYFAGRGAFRAKRDRRDFPDAFILQALRGLAFDAILLTADDQLAKVANSEGRATAVSLDAVLKLEALKELHANVEFAIWWEGHHLAVIDALRQQHEDRLRAIVHKLVPGTLEGSEVRNGDIPDDNNEAMVVTASEPSDIEFDWSTAESLGEGLLSIPTQFESEIELAFSVYRGESFNVPSWVHVSFGNFEEGHYFDADGTRVAHFVGRIVMSFSPQEGAKDLDISGIVIDDGIDCELQGVELDDWTD